MSEITIYENLIGQIQLDRRTAVDALAGALIGSGGIRSDIYEDALRNIAMVQIAIAAVREVAQEAQSEERARLANPNRGCDADGWPLDPKHL